MLHLVSNSFNLLTSDAPSWAWKQNPSEISMCPHAPCQKWLVLIGCSLETKLSWVLESSGTWNARHKLSFETKLTIPHSLCNFSQIFLGLGHGFWKNWWKSIWQNLCTPPYFIMHPYMGLFYSVYHYYFILFGIAFIKC